MTEDKRIKGEREKGRRLLSIEKIEIENRKSEIENRKKEIENRK